MRTFLCFLVATLAVANAAPHHDKGHHDQYGTKVGSFRNYNHGIGGVVYAKDERTIFIKDFEYDGQGPDAFFWVGTTGNPSAVGTILPYPFKGKFYEYEDGDAPILEGRFDKVDITLTLPDNLKVTDLKWISVWCRAFKVNFGDVFFPADLELYDDADAESEAESEGDAESEAEAESSYPEAEAEGEAEAESGDAHKPHDLPPPLLPPDSNAHDGDHHHHDDPDAYAEGEAESEAESEAEAESSGNKFTSSLLLPLALMLALRW